MHDGKFVVGCLCAWKYFDHMFRSHGGSTRANRTIPVAHQRSKYHERVLHQRHDLLDVRAFQQELSSRFELTVI